MLKTWISAACVAATALAAPAGVSAQSRPSAEPDSVRRPYRGIFGGGGDPSSPQTLIFNGSVYGAYDDNIVAGLTNRKTRDPFLQQSGAYQGVDAGLEYTFQKKANKYSLATAAGAMARYAHSPESDSTTPYAHVDLQFDWHMTHSTLLSTSQSTAYASRYNFAFLPRTDAITGQDIPFMSQPDFDLFGLPALRSTSAVILTQQLGRRNTSVSAGYLYRTVNVLEDVNPGDRYNDYRTQTGLLRFNHTHPLSAHAELQLGYGIRVSDRRSGTGEPRVMQTVNAGVNYSRALSFSRRTSLTFSTGTAILDAEHLEDGTGDSRPRFRLVGDASLVRELGRTWTAHAGYARAVRARDGFAELYFTDMATADLNGLITRRLSWTAAAAWARSTLERAGNNGHRGQSVTSQATYALNNSFALFARYIYYKYRYDEGILLDSRLPRALDRQGVRVGVTTSVPLIR
jgi:hypothetical protein